MVKSFKRCPYENLLIYTVLRTFQNNQVTTMISYVIFIYSGNFQKFLNDSTYLQKLLKASIGMEKKILGNSGLLGKLKWQYIFNF